MIVVVYYYLDFVLSRLIYCFNVINLNGVMYLQNIDEDVSLLNLFYTLKIRVLNLSSPSTKCLK